MTTLETGAACGKTIPFLESTDNARIRFAGDSGDGMQLTGTQFALAAALAHHDFTTFPDFPAEIRAPAGAIYGVSSYSINFGAVPILTPGDHIDVLVAMNPAALKTQCHDLRSGGLIIVDNGAFNARNLAKAGYASSPLEDDSLAPYHVLSVDMSKQTLNAIAPIGLGRKAGLRCKNMWALGLTFWLFARDRQPVIDWLRHKFAKTRDIAEANIAALNAGHIYGETAELGEIVTTAIIPKATQPAGRYRTIRGIDAAAEGLLAASVLAGLPIFFGSYPITPASPLLHNLAARKDQPIITFQAEDEIAAIGAAIGAAYGGAIGVTASSGPGIALKTEALGLAIATELPLLLINIQRGGPSTGLPTKTEQSDLYQAVFGRNADTPLPVLAAASASDCFDIVIDAVRIALNFMTPVILLLDGAIANTAEPWKIPDLSTYKPIRVDHNPQIEGFHPYRRDPITLARNWAIPGTPGLEHRIGGLERDYDSGHISYDPANHQRMTKTRCDKILRLAEILPRQEICLGNQSGPLAIVSWGSTFGAVHSAVKQAQAMNIDVSHLHLRQLNPLPANLKTLLAGFDQTLVAELNNGQLHTLIRSECLVDTKNINQVSGRPFQIHTLVEAICSAASLNNIA